jgi:hypothetical protein
MRFLITDRNGWFVIHADELDEHTDAYALRAKDLVAIQSLRPGGVFRFRAPQQGETLIVCVKYPFQD